MKQHVVYLNLEVYYAAYKDGETLWEIDKRNMKCVIGNVPFAEFIKIIAQQQASRLSVVMRDPTVQRNKVSEL